MMKIRDGIILTKVMGQSILVDNTGTIKGVIKLNETAEFVWQHLQEGLTVEDIAKLVCAEFDIEEDVALRDIKALCEKFEKQGVLIC